MSVGMVNGNSLFGGMGVINIAFKNGHGILEINYAATLKILRKKKYAFVRVRLFAHSPLARVRAMRANRFHPWQVKE